FFITVVWFFFFSSRRRHTRFSRDWSSDVCSSDLAVERLERLGDGRLLLGAQLVVLLDAREVDLEASRGEVEEVLLRGLRSAFEEIGRASCRERVWDSEADGQ